MKRKLRLSGLCNGCGIEWPHPEFPGWYSQFWAVDEGLEDSTREGMIIKVAVSQHTTREGAIYIVGRAAAREGKSFDESLKAYWHLYTDRTIPQVTGYGGRTQSRAVVPVVIPEPLPIQTGRIQSRGAH